MHAERENDNLNDVSIFVVGKETKMMLSQGAAKYKRSTLERVTNYFVLYCVAVLVLMVVGCGIASIIWLKYHNAHMNRMPFVILETSGAVQDGLINMASYILTYQVKSAVRRFHS